MSVLYRTYRPSTFADVIGQTYIRQILSEQVRSNTTAHAYLFTGPRGVGKTTLARVVTRAVNCKNRADAEPCNTCDSCTSILQNKAMDIMEIDAASHTDVDHVREQILENVRFPPSQSKFKIYIIDEVHMLSQASFNALLKTLEEPPAHVIFFLATTEIHKVPATIVSRCQRFDFRKIPIADMVDRLKSLAQKEGKTIEDSILEDIARLSDGCERDAESLLGQVFSLGETTITRDLAQRVLPQTDTPWILAFLSALWKKDAATVFQSINEVVANGKDLRHIIDELIRATRELLMYRAGVKKEEGSLLVIPFDPEFLKLIQTDPTSRLLHLLELLLEARASSRLDRFPQLGLEMATAEWMDHNPQLQTSQPVPNVAPIRRSEVGSPVTLTPPPVVSAQHSSVTPSVQRSDMSHTVPLVPLSQSPITSAPPPATGRVSDPVETQNLASLSKSEIESKWPNVCQKVREKSATLPLMIQSATIGKVVGSSIEIQVAFSLHVDTLKQDKQRKILEPIFEEVYGQKLSYTVVVKPQPAAPIDDVADSLASAFGGKVM